MKKINIKQIKEKAKKLSKGGKDWHFHILTPRCKLNVANKYALILENVSDKETFVTHSDTPYMGVGEELVKLLHGDDIIQNEGKKTELSPSSQVVKEKILKRAKELTENGVFWHHHMLFPGCIFNDHDDKWVIVFEDQEENTVIESITDNEPKTDLQHIERLFYTQKK